MNGPNAKITLRLWHGEHTVEMFEAPVTIDEVFENLVEPVLLSAGFARKNIDEYLGFCGSCPVHCKTSEKEE